MKLSALRLHNVRRFANRGIAIEDIREGVNVLCAANEFGKSTCFDALHALFFQPHSGTPGAVNLLRPYSGGSPLIEADVMTNDGEFRLQKQFYSGRRAIVTDLRSGRLIAQADEAERIIVDLVRGGTSGPAGLLWVRQGITGLDRRAKSEEEGEKHARETALSSVRGEVEALTGGRRMSDVLNACVQELLTLVTATGRPKSGGLYATAIEERDRLKMVELRLEAEVNDLRGALDERRIARSQLKELEDPAASALRRQAAEVAEKYMTEGQAHAQALAAATVELALLTNALNQATIDRDAYRVALVRAETLKIVRQEALKQRGEVLALEQSKVRALDEAGQAVDAAERDEQMARNLLTQLGEARLAREAMTTLAGLREALSKGETAQRETEDGEAALRTLVVPLEQLKNLERLEVEIASLTAAQAAKAPTLRVAYEAGAEIRIAIDGHAFSDGEVRQLQPRSAVIVPGIATLAFKLGDEEDGTTSLSAATSAHQNLLVKIGVKSLAEARQREASACSKHAEIELSKQRLALLAPKGLATIRENIARLEREATDVPDVAGNSEDARATWETADRRVADARNVLRELRPAREQAQKAVIASERTVATVTAELAGIVTILGPEPDRLKREQTFAAAFDKTSVAHAEADTKRATLQGSAPDLASLEATLNRTRSAVIAATTQSTNLREFLADLNGRIRTRADDAVEEIWLETRALREEADRRVVQFEREIAVLSKLRESLEAARVSARDHYFEPVMMELRPLMGLLFDDAAVAFDDETLLPMTVQRNGQTEDVDRLSGGMREQLAVLTRLAFARLLARDGRPAPVILDDALVYSDDDRIEKMFDALHRQSCDQQIIVFSCRQRAFTGLGGNILRMTDWRPQSG